MSGRVGVLRRSRSAGVLAPSPCGAGGMAPPVPLRRGGQAPCAPMASVRQWPHRRGCDWRGAWFRGRRSAQKRSDRVQAWSTRSEAGRARDEIDVQGAGGAAGAPCRPVGLSELGGVECGEDVSLHSAGRDTIGRCSGLRSESCGASALGGPAAQPWGRAGGVQIITSDLGEKLPVPTVVSACPSILLPSAVPRGAARMDATGMPAPRSGVRVPSNQLKE